MHDADKLSLVYRPLTGAEIPALGVFFAANANPETVRHFTPFPLTPASAEALGRTMPGDRFYAAYLGARIVGFSMLRGWYEGHRVPSFGLLVDSAYRGQRVGRGLTEYTLSVAARDGVTKVRLSVNSSNARGVALYQNLGFVEQSRSAILVDGMTDEKLVMAIALTRPPTPKPIRPFIPVATPALVGREREYVLDCLDTNWISSNGKYIDRFERAFAEFCGTRHAISCCNGTVALHAALLGLGIGPGDEVIIPTLTYIASANAVTYCGATPVFVDSDAETWNLDPAAVAAAVTPRTRAIMPVHLYGHPCDMDPILAVAERHGLAVVEDAAEAHGAEYRGRRVGGIGTVATFSFFGNKVITTGEGGMITTDDDALASRIRVLKGQGQDVDRRYWFPVVGYNYRMTNIEAAIGLGQLEKIDWHLSRRRHNAMMYRERLSVDPRITTSPEMSWAKSAFWIACALLPPDSARWRDEVMAMLAAQGVETRPFFYPMHTMPPYRSAGKPGQFPIAESLAARGLNLPSSAILTDDDICYVSENLLSAIHAVA